MIWKVQRRNILPTEVFSSGFTLIELLIVMGISGILMALVLVNLVRPQNTASLSGAVDTLVTDLKSQQVKAMAGDSLSATSAQAHGIYVQSGSYTIFKGSTYSAGDADNFVVTLDAGVTLSTTFASTQVVFSRVSGEVSGFAAGSNTITVTNNNSGNSKTITLNRYGVVTVN